MKRISLVALVLVMAGCGSGGYYSGSHGNSGLGQAAETQRWIVESPHYQAGGSSYVDYTK